MSGLCGWLTSRRARPVPSQVAQSMAATLTRFDDARPCTVSAPNAAIVVATNTPGDGSLFGNGPLVALWGHARVGQARACGAEIVQALAHGYRDKGPHIVRALHGAFALAIVDAD